MATAKKAGAAKKGGGSAAKKSSAKSAAKKGGSAAKKTSKSSRSSGASAKRGAGGSASKRGAGGQGRANAAFMKAMQPSQELAAVIGDRPMPRTEVTKRLWDYIKKNDLQDAKNRRQINADDRLRPIFGGRRNVTMFELTKLVNQHLREP
jgi:chromatin remodeling complex protein RSC6